MNSILKGPPMPPLPDADDPNREAYLRRFADQGIEQVIDRSRTPADGRLQDRNQVPGQHRP